MEGLLSLVVAVLEPTLWHGAYDTLRGITNGVGFLLILAFLTLQRMVNDRRVAALQRATGRAHPVTALRYPLRFVTRGPATPPVRQAESRGEPAASG